MNFLPFPNTTLPGSYNITRSYDGINFTTLGLDVRIFQILVTIIKTIQKLSIGDFFLLISYGFENVFNYEKKVVKVKDNNANTTHINRTNNYRNMLCPKTNGLNPTYFIFLASGQLTTSGHCPCLCIVHLRILCRLFVWKRMCTGCF
jgi:hypothetical protein